MRLHKDSSSPVSADPASPRRSSSPASCAALGYVKGLHTGIGRIYPHTGVISLRNRHVMSHVSRDPWRFELAHRGQAHVHEPVHATLLGKTHRGKRMHLSCESKLPDEDQSDSGGTLRKICTASAVSILHARMREGHGG